MRSLLASVLLIASAHLVHAGALVELHDGTKLPVDSYWTDGDELHLVRGGVDLIVDKSRVKSIDDDATDDDTGGTLGNAEARQDGEPSDAGRAKVREADEPAGEAGDDEATADAGADEPQAEGETQLSEMTVDELETLHRERSRELLDAQQRRFSALYGGKASNDEKKAADAAFRKENKASAAIWFQLEKARAAQAQAPEAPAVPAVPQPE